AQGALQVRWVVGFSRGKDVAALLARLVQAGDVVWAVPFAKPQEMPWISCEQPEAIAEAVQKLGMDGVAVEVFGALGEAVDRLAGDQLDGYLNVICGSLYLVSDVYRVLQVVSLTKIKSKGKVGRREIMVKVTDAIDTYDYVWVFSVENMRNQYLKQVRRNLGTSQIFMGSNKVMAKALGNDEESELKPNLHKISEALSGEVGLVCTNMDVEETKRAFSEFSAKSYARAGNIAEYQVVVKAGEVVRGVDEEPFPNNMEPTLRGLGMPTVLKQGKILLDNDYVVCEEGDKLTANQAHLLKHLWEQMATFTVKPVAYWHKSSGEFVNLKASSDKEGEGKGESESDESDDDME
ncbi:mRNA turnover and ribosome assembly protein, partial [Coemansia sp. RSA 2705]